MNIIKVITSEPEKEQVTDNEVLKKESEKNTDSELIPIVTESEIKNYRDDLLTSHVDLVHQAFNNAEAKEQLVKVIQKEYRFKKNTEGFEKAKLIANKLVGFDFLEQFIGDPEISDIGWNGRFLTVEGNNLIKRYSSTQLGMEDSENTIYRIVRKFADTVGKAFSPEDPILDAVAGSLRLNAMHTSLSPTGTTMSLRMIKSVMSLQESNFQDFAPDFVLDFLRVCMATGNSCLIGGETGSGKTELMKLMLSFTKIYHKIILMEDVDEMNLSTLLPDHDIYSLVTNSVVGYSELISASLRNHPTWIVPSESRGAEAFEAIEGARTGHKLLSSLHVPDCRSMPRRYVTMSSMGRTINEEALLEDVLTFFDFGFHIKTAKIEVDTDPDNLTFYKVRYLSEIVEFSPGSEGITTVFKQNFVNGKFLVTTGTFSDRFKERLAENFLDFEFPELKDSEVEKSAELNKHLVKQLERVS